MTPRKGHLRRADIPPDILKQLNAMGRCRARAWRSSSPSILRKLFKALIPEVIEQAINASSKHRWLTGVLTRMKVCGEVLHDTRGLDALPELIVHPNDTLRGWACYVIGHAPGLTLAQRLQGD